MYAVNECARRSWSYDFFRFRLRLLGLRHDTFGKLLEEPNIKWNEEANRMFGTKEDWSRIIRENPFAKAYYYFGELKWEQLQEIFGGRVGPPYSETSEELGNFSFDGSNNSACSSWGETR
ncbi:UNVERIFIED_CONTAM: hypothetical protein Sindi_0929200 [Sesamum indicum]